MNRAVVLPNHYDERVAFYQWPSLIRLPHEGSSSLHFSLMQPHVPDVPESWRLPVMTTIAMVLLALLDFVGAIFAKEWADKGHVILLVGGLASFTVLFVVYSRVLAVADLSIVTLGWVIFLQIGMLAIDRLRYGMTLPWYKWAAILVILVLQTYLLAGASEQRQRAEVETDSSAAGLHPISQPLLQ